jgi:CheY-like chemotaxis protein
MTTVAVRKSQEALAMLYRALEARDPFDLCILDIQMPGMSGYDIAKGIRGFKAAGCDPQSKIHLPHSKRGTPRLGLETCRRAHVESLAAERQSALQQLPLLALSSCTGKEARECFTAGFDGYLPKPVHRQKLLAMIAKLLGEPKDKHHREQRQAIVTQYSLRENAKRDVRILLAEDHPVNQKLAKKLLAKAGYQVEVANDGKEAASMYEASPEAFDIIFMDVQMPEMDGLEATAEIRKSESGMEKRRRPEVRNPKSEFRIPIVAMTAQVMKGDREKCFEAGMDDYIAKPIRRETVFAMIDKWVLSEKEQSDT